MGKEMTIDEALAQLCILAGYAAELSSKEVMQTQLIKTADLAEQWLGEILAHRRIAELKERIIEAGEEEPEPIMVVSGGKIDDHGKFTSLVKAGWPKAEIAKDFHCDVKTVEEYAKAHGIQFKPGVKRKWKPLENLSGDL